MSEQAAKGIKVWPWLLAAFIGFLAFQAMNPPAPKTAAEQLADQKTYLQAAGCRTAQDIIRDRLKAPATAVFPSCASILHPEDTSYEVDMKKHTVVVQSYVDAQNGFGAQIRNNWTVWLKQINTDPTDPRFVPTKVVMSGR